MDIIEPYGFIYITTNMISGKRYIGQKKFIKGWKTYLGSGVILKNSINKYGKENFIRNIVTIAYSKDELDNLEIEFIKNYNAVESDDYYNIAFGGGAVSLSGEKNGMYNRTHTNEARKKISESHIGRKHKPMSKETRKKLSLANGGKIHSKEWNQNSSKAHKGIIPSLKTRNKMRESHKGLFAGERHPLYGKHHSAESKNKMSESRKSEKNSFAKKVICLITGEIFGCIADANIKYSIAIGSISNCCRGKQKTAGIFNSHKLTWMYYEDYLKQESEVA